MRKLAVTLIAVLMVLSKKLWFFLRKLVKGLLLLSGVSYLTATLFIPELREGAMWEEAIKGIGFFGSLIVLTGVELLAFRRGGKVQVPKWFTITELILIFVVTYGAVMISNEVKEKRLQKESVAVFSAPIEDAFRAKSDEPSTEELVKEGEKELARLYEIEQRKNNKNFVQLLCNLPLKSHVMSCIFK